MPPPRLKRATIIVLDGVGVGALPDAGDYGDAGSDTLGHVAAAVGGLRLPTLEVLGLGCLHAVAGVPCPATPRASYGRMAELSVGKDTTVGHWEMAGLPTLRPFPTYAHGFPPDLIAEYERRIGRPVLGNKVASGTVIIEELGAEHLRTGYPIVYTSADSVFQIAAHEDVIPLERLYEMCLVARALLTGEHAVARVIARPFVGAPGAFVRTTGRKDFSLEPQGDTLLDRAKAAGLDVIGVGKIGDIFVHRGLTQEIKTTGNADGMRAVGRCLAAGFGGLLFANLVDFDMLFGHRNDVAGFAAALAEFDAGLAQVLPLFTGDDALFITADHGGDPTTTSTDHAREYVPLLCYGPALAAGVDLGVRATFADLGATVAEFLGMPAPSSGHSFAAAVRRPRG
ncbi:MAG: phosphopentomutase [Anaerolineae bacterium]